MKHWLLLLLMMLTAPLMAKAQSSEVRPGELAITVTVDERNHPPMKGEMVLITIRGLYRRHITRERLKQPDLDGFNWSQLGQDVWTEERVNGRQVKIFTRRMALYPVRDGPLTIGPFTHALTLTDEGDDWFEYDVTSGPVTINVEPALATEGWWFPVRRLRISDEWSNAPDQLQPGEGVLRVIRVEALGAMPEMIPPMPELTSPSAMIFPHPERRLVELTPEGPITYAFWRWTIRPTNDVSAIVEPMTFSYYDTFNRKLREVSISPQRVAYGDVTPNASGGAPEAEPFPSGNLPGWPVLAVAALVFAAGTALGLRRWRIEGLRRLVRRAGLDPLNWKLKSAARAGDVRAMRRAAAAILKRDGANPARLELLSRLDRIVFARTTPGPGELARTARDFNAASGTG